jgi:hypothetical protein
VLVLRATELLAYGAALELELRGLRLGWLSATRALNQRANRHWSARQWWLLLRTPYGRLIGARSHATSNDPC